MPRPGPDLYSFAALWRSYRQCRRTKRNTFNALGFEIDAEAQLLRLQEQLRSHEYRPGRSICFITEGPKPREVFAADFRDRIVHHLLVDLQERIFEPVFIADSFACRKNKGSLAASDRLAVFLRRITANGRRRAWSLKLDVASFFPSIHKPTLHAILERRVREPELRWLTRTLLVHDPTSDYRFRSLRPDVPRPQTPGYPVPEHKSLFGRNNVRGLAIGNLTSQFWANVYLNEVDQFVKHELRCRYYARYVDDMVLLADSPDQLCEWREAIAEYLFRRLSLRLRAEPAEAEPVGRGVDFVGWRTWWNRRVPRRQTLGKLEQRLAAFERAAVRPAWGGTAQCLEVGRPAVRGEVRRLRAALASYGGHLRHGAAWRPWGETWAQRAWLRLLFGRDDWRVIDSWSVLRPLTQPRFAQQYRRLLRHAGDDVLVFCQVGKFVELYGPQRLAALRRLPLAMIYLPRAGFGYAVGFPLKHAAVFEKRALAAGAAVVHVGECGEPAADACAPRRVTRMALPASA